MNITERTYFANRVNSVTQRLAKPAKLPFEQPTRFRFPPFKNRQVIRLPISGNIACQADEVLE
jgi:hypothetical protein